jgi:aspartyl-tRNA(Asn)/glutamyl-tRNA(Gln) amidotransferase subunit A
MTTVADMSAAEIVAAVRHRTLTCTDVVSAFLQRCTDAHELTGCFVDIDRAAAIRRAEGLDRLNEEERARRPLLGVPYAYKDVFIREGGRSPGVGEAHSHLAFRATEATALSRLDAAGAIALGRLKLDPLGYAATGLNDELGDTVNPWDTTRISGGSSAGAAAAVATGAVPIAIGSDTGGSIRIPAALCGVAGLKPTYGRISRRGSAPLSYSQDTIGILARTVYDTALALNVLAGYDDQDPGSIDVPVPKYGAEARPRRHAPLAGLRFGVDMAYTAHMAGREVTQAMSRACEVFESLGAEIVSVELGVLVEYDAAAEVLTWAEAVSVYASDYRARRSTYGASARARLDLALMAQGSMHVDALRIQGMALQGFLDGVLAQCDLVVTPAAGVTAPAIDELRGGPEDPVAITRSLLTLNRPYNFLGLPSLAVPIGYASDGLPMGLQLAGRPWSEPTIIRAGIAYQGATTWHRRTPMPHQDANSRLLRTASSDRTAFRPPALARHHAGEPTEESLS